MYETRHQNHAAWVKAPSGILATSNLHARHPAHINRWRTCVEACVLLCAAAAVAEAFVRLHDKGLIYRGSYMVNWSPALGTAVSDLEVEYSEEQGFLYFFKWVHVDIVQT